ncbi:MAG: aminotransferase class V-fold PLP-dependent enzyme, partial [Nocardioides sp.]
MSLPPKPPSTERSHAGSGGGYLDGASGEPLHPHARETLLAALDLGYADPRRLHGAARRSRLLLDNAREAAAEALGLRADEVTFVSSGTQAVHLGLLGLLPPAVGGRPGDAGPRAIWRSAVEHSAVAHALAWSGRTTEVLPVTSTGRLDLAALPTDG